MSHHPRLRLPALHSVYGAQTTTCTESSFTVDSRYKTGRLPRFICQLYSLLIALACAETTSVSNQRFHNDLTKHIIRAYLSPAQCVA